jgi:hypothetical protein
VSRGSPGNRGWQRARSGRADGTGDLLILAPFFGILKQWAPAHQSSRVLALPVHRKAPGANT